MVVSVVPVVGMVAAAVRVAAGRVAAAEQPKKNRIPLPHLPAGGVLGGGCWSRVAATVGCGGFGEWRRATESDMGDRIDRLMGNLFGFAGKCPPENIPPAAAWWPAGRRPAVGVGENY
nr:hypothetical protein [Tanacetum cinerariifolium]